MNRALILFLLATAAACDAGGRNLDSSTRAEGAAGGGTTGGRDTSDHHPPPGEIIPGEDVGTLPGDLQVSPGGSLSYTIPIAVPKGIRGQEPHLALRYSSGGGTGALGVGWNVSGISSIHRCGADLAHDGDRRPIAWTIGDNLCFDGQRLVAKIPDQYGKNGAEYRTERDGNLKIVASEASTAADSSFTVYYPDGRIARYGSAEDTRVLFGTTPYAWDLARTEDRFGNAIVYSYTHDEDEEGVPHTDHRISSICYGDNPGAGVRCSREVEFEYTPHLHCDVKDGACVWKPQFLSRGYVSGLEQTTWHRLTTIRTRAMGKTVGEVRMGFDEHLGIGEPVVLRTVQACDGANICLPPTSLSWSTPASGYQQIDAGFEFAGGKLFDGPWAAHSVMVASVYDDFDGDLKTDALVAHISQPRWVLWSSAKGASTTPIITNVDHPFRTPYEVGGGLWEDTYDFRRPRFSSSLSWNGRDVSVISLVPHMHLNELTAHPEAVFGDGDFPLHPGVGDKMQVIISNGDDTFGQAILDDNVTNPILYMHVLDLDRDGLSDLVWCRSDVDQHGKAPWLPENTKDDLAWNAGHLFFARNQPNVGLSLADGGKATGLRCGLDDWTYVVDVDGDGDDELLQILSRNAHGLPVPPALRASTYTAIAYDPAAANLVARSTGFPRDDFRLRTTDVKVETTVWAPGAYSLEQGFGPETIPVLGYGAGPAKWGDFDGDGMIDAVVPNPGDTSELWFYYNRGDGFEKVTYQIVEDGWQSNEAAAMLYLNATLTDWNSDGKADILLPTFAIDYDGTNEHDWVGATTVDILLGTANRDLPLSFGGEVEQWSGVLKNFDFDRVTPLVAADLDRDGLVDLIQRDGVTDRWMFYKHQGDLRGNLLTAVENGLGARSEIVYAPLAASGHYSETFAEPLFYPLARKPSSTPVVITVRQDSGVGTMKSPSMWEWSYRYENNLFDHVEGGLGMEYRTVEHWRPFAKGAWKTTTYEHFDNRSYDKLLGAYPRAGALLASLTVVEPTVPDPQTPMRSYLQLAWSRTETVTGGVAGTFRNQLKSTTQKSFESPPISELNRRCLINHEDCEIEYPQHKTPLSFTTTTFDVRDALGHVTQSTTTTPAGVTTTAASWLNDTGSWILDFPSSELVLDQPTGAPSEYRMRSFAYLAGKAAVQQIDVEPNRDAYKHRLWIDYDPFGNATQESRLDLVTFELSWTHTDWSADGVFPQTVTDMLNHPPTTTMWHAGLDVPLQVTAPSGQTEVFTYDGFGRRLKAQTWKGDVPLGPAANTRYERVDTDDDRMTRLTSWQDDAGVTVSLLDRRGRTFSTEQPLFEDKRQTVSAVYDESGLLVKLTRPKEVGGVDQGATRYTYDGLGRVLTTTLPDETVISSVYEGPVTRTTDPLGHTSSITVDGLGRKVRSDGSSDPTTPDAPMCFAYGPFNQLLSVSPCTRTVVTPTPFNPVTFTYDAYNRVLEVEDDRTGHRSFRYDNVGRLRRVTDALGAETKLRYDVLDRLAERQNGDGTATWVYDQEVPLTLSERHAPQGYVERDHYDGLGRPDGTDYVFADRTYSSVIHYNPRGQIGSIDYPTAHPDEHFAVAYGYDANDRLTTVSDALTNHPLWHLDAVNPQGQPTLETLGNGTEHHFWYEPFSGRVEQQQVVLDDDVLEAWTYAWNLDGTLASRTHAGLETNNGAEDFLYDAKRRLVKHRVWLLGELNTCDQFGCTDDDQVSYEPYGNILSRTKAGSYSYTGGRLTGIAAKGLALGYTYDANGNALERKQNGVATTLTWNALHKVRTLNGPDGYFGYTYDADGTKLEEVDYGTGQRNRYIGGLLETTTGGDLGNGMAASSYVALPGGTQLQVLRTFKDKAVNAYSETLTYGHRDSLGSTTLMTGPLGEMVARMSFGPWGGERDPESWTSPVTTPETPGRFNKGFTGHEARARAGLIDMKARLYDPVAARFVQADTVVASPLSSQSWNHYSYVENQPLVYTDPTGHSPEGDACEGAADCYNLRPLDCAEGDKNCNPDGDGGGGGVDPSGGSGDGGHGFDPGANEAPPPPGAGHCNGVCPGAGSSDGALARLQLNLQLGELSRAALAASVDAEDERPLIKGDHCLDGGDCGRMGEGEIDRGRQLSFWMGWFGALAVPSMVHDATTAPPISVESAMNLGGLGKAWKFFKSEAFIAKLNRLEEGLVLEHKHSMKIGKIRAAVAHNVETFAGIPEIRSGWGRTQIAGYLHDGKFVPHVNGDVLVYVRPGLEHISIQISRRDSMAMSRFTAVSEVEHSLVSSAISFVRRNADDL